MINGIKLWLKEQERVWRVTLFPRVILTIFNSKYMAAKPQFFIVAKKETDHLWPMNWL